MNTGGSTGTGGDGLYVHWTKAKNERVDVLEARGISAPNLRQQVRRLTALAANTNIKAPIFHFWFPPNPSDRQPTRAELDSLLDRMEAEFNLKNTARIGVRHTLSRNMNDAERGKSWGRPMDSGDVLEDIAPDPAAQRHASWDGIDTHEHYAYLGIDEHGRALDHLRFSRIRRERVIVEWQVAHGFKITPMRHITAVLADLDVRNPEAARAMRDAGFLERRRAASDPAGIDPQPGPGIDTGSPSAIAMYGSGERAQMDRAADVGPSGKTRHAFNVRKDVLAAWKSSDTGDSFRVALEDRGYRLLMGSTSPVVVDPAGIVVRATEIIGTASRKLDGKGIPAADVHERLKGMDLTPLDDARAEHADPAGVAKGGAVVRDTPEPVTSGASRAEPTDNIYKETDHAYDAHATDARAPGETGPGGPQGGGRLGDIGGRGDEDRHVGDIGGFESGPVRDPDGGDFIEPKQRYAERDFGGKDGRRGADAGRPDRIGAGGRPHLLGRLRAAVGANRIKTAALHPTARRAVSTASLSGWGCSATATNRPLRRPISSGARRGTAQ
jgi:hypothetical protein